LEEPLRLVPADSADTQLPAGTLCGSSRVSVVPHRWGGKAQLQDITGTFMCGQSPGCNQLGHQGTIV